jgi:hypothetical protein
VTMGRSKLSSLAACVLLSLWGSSALAQERLSRRESMRSIVTPSLIWRFDAGASITTQPVGSALVTLPHLGATVGVPGVGIPWRGLEFSANVADFVVAPSPPAFGYVPQLALTQRLSPSASYPVTAEVRDAFELALRLQLGVDPILGKPFRIGGSIPLVFRAPDVLRIDLVPGLFYQAVYERGLLDAPLRVLLQLADSFYLAAVSGVSSDLRDAKSTTIPLGAQLGVTVPGDFGPLLDVIVDAGFPALFGPARSTSKVYTDEFRVMATFRLFTFWDLNASDPNQSSDAEAKRRRCGEIP